MPTIRTGQRITLTEGQQIRVTRAPSPALPSRGGRRYGGPWATWPAVWEGTATRLHYNGPHLLALLLDGVRMDTGSATTHYLAIGDDGRLCTTVEPLPDRLEREAPPSPHRETAGSKASGSGAGHLTSSFSPAPDRARRRGRRPLR